MTETPTPLEIHCNELPNLEAEGRREMSETATPRTDAACEGSGSLTDELLVSSFARQLVNDLAAANKDRSKIRSELDDIVKQLAEAKAKIKDLQTALHLTVEAHKEELAAKDAEIERLKGNVQQYRAEFLWPHDEGSVEQAGYEFANGRTEGYRKEWWNILLARIEQAKEE